MEEKRKKKKEPKPRAEKYEAKVAVNMDFADIIKLSTTYDPKKYEDKK